jgi:RNA polymerase sigma factor (sigma-70 family)
MLDQRRAAAQLEDNREQLFTERYESLIVWAVRLTNDRAAAEDLVQDAFIQFMIGRTRLEEIENIDGYLRRMLRYMHIARMSRPSQRLQDTTLSVADYDTCRLGWTAVETPRRMQASEELHQICVYACSRKESSRAGSVLILRFFHDYFPTEIARVLSTSRTCVDQWQRLARREAKLFISQPNRLRFVDVKAPTAPAWIEYPGSDCDLMLALRRMILNSCNGICLTPEELEKAYAPESADTLSTPRLAHVVSCPECLDAVNTHLGLPLLAQRYETDKCDADEPPRDGAGGGSGSTPTVLPNRFKQQLRETREHKPKELRIALNGCPVSSFKITSELSEFDLNLTSEEPLEFIEVSSEQGIQLLFLGINDTESEDEQWAEIELSEGRTLEVCLRVREVPRLHVVYVDSVAAEVSLNNAVKGKVLSSPLTVVPRVLEAAQERSTFGERARRLLAALKRVFGRTTERESSAAPPDLFEATIGYRRGSGYWPVFVTVLVSFAAVVAGILLYKSKLESAVSATNLLERARVVETSNENSTDRVGNQTTNLEVRLSSEGAVVSRHSIVSWEDYARGQRIQRLYNESGRLIAATTQSGDRASRTVYHHGSKAQRAGANTPENLLLDLDDIWELTPSARDFQQLIAEPAAAEVRETSTSYVVQYQKERVIGASRLLKATLTLAKSDLHPTEQTLLVQRGAETREYRFVVTDSKLLPTNSVAPAVFDVEPELIGETGAESRSGDWARRDHPSGTPASTSTIASSELEIDVEYLLNQVKANRNEQVALTRNESGSLRVEGVVDTAERRTEFLRALAPVINNPAVSIRIRTVAEASKESTNGATASVRELEVTANTIAVDQELRDYFSRRGSNTESVDEAVRSYSSRVVDGAYRALFHAVKLKRLTARFAGVDMRALAPDARLKWLAMLREHSTAFDRETTALSEDLATIFPLEKVDITEDLTIESDADLIRAVERLHRLALAVNEALRGAFVISSQSSASAFKAAQFRQSVAKAQILARRISQAANSDRSAKSLLGEN